MSRLTGDILTGVTALLFMDAVGSPCGLDRRGVRVGPGVNGLWKKYYLEN